FVTGSERNAARPLVSWITVNPSSLAKRSTTVNTSGSSSMTRRVGAFVRSEGIKVAVRALLVTDSGTSHQSAVTGRHGLRQSLILKSKLRRGRLTTEWLAQGYSLDESDNRRRGFNKLHETTMTARRT